MWRRGVASSNGETSVVRDELCCRRRCCYGRCSVDTWSAECIGRLSPQGLGGVDHGRRRHIPNHKKAVLHKKHNTTDNKI